jgi:hypothetical protein
LCNTPNLSRRLLFEFVLVCRADCLPKWPFALALELTAFLEEGENGADWGKNCLKRLANKNAADWQFQLTRLGD